MSEIAFKVELNARRLIQVLLHHQITTVFDVGANVGQYAVRLRHAGYRGRIISFEALSEAYYAVQAASQSDPDWEVALRCALGERNGQASLIRSSEPDMSSLLPMRQDMAQVLDRAAPCGSESVPMYRLDSIFDQHASPSDRMLLKIDTQGYDLKVLEGAKGILQHLSLIQIEMAIIPVYEDEPDWLESARYLLDLGFSPVLFTPGYFNRRSARLFSMDGMFARL